MTDGEMNTMKAARCQLIDQLSTYTRHPTKVLPIASAIRELDTVIRAEERDRNPPRATPRRANTGPG